MITVNSISGGQTSAYVAAKYEADLDIFSLVRTNDKSCEFKDKKLASLIEDKIQKPFVGTLEDDRIVHTILELEQHIGREITWVSGYTFDEIISQKNGYLPNKVARYCTTELKTIPIASYLYEKGLSPVEMRFGYRANETRRANSMNAKLNESGIVEVKIKVGKHENGNNKWKTIEYQKPSYPLIKDGIYKDNIVEYWRDKNVKFAKFNNCVGCWWRNEIMLKKMSEEHPRKMEWFAKKEETTGNRFKTDITYRKIIEHKLQMELFDDDFNDCDSGYCGI
jgi:hypothetical protein